MAIEWSGLSPELLVRLDRSASQPLRAQLEASLREAIRGGRLRAGERLPSSRELARDARRLPRHGAGLLRAAAGRGIPDQPHRVRHPGRRHQRPAQPATSPRPARPWSRPRRPRRPPASGTAADRGLPARRTGPVQLPAYRLGLGRQAGVHPGRRRGPGIRRPARQRGTARGPRRLPAAGTGRRRQPGADDHQHRLRARNQPGPARPGPPRRRDAAWPSKTPATAARRPTKRSARPWRWASTSATCRSTSKASWSASWRPAEPRRSWSPRPTSPPPGWSCPRHGGTP